MTIIYLGLGSNLNAEENLRCGVRELGRRFELREVSAVYRNRPVGFEGDDFLNAVACADTDLSPAAVCKELEEIHELAGRIRGVEAFESRTLDIDLLLYGQDIIEAQHVPRSDILEYSFVLRPLAEIAPGVVHPQTGKTIATHWSEFDAALHPLERVPLILLNGDA